MTNASEPKVVLVSMPWTTLVQPSLGLAVLRSSLLREKIPVHIYHANLDLLKHVSAETYDSVSECWGLNDFIFSLLLDDNLDDFQILSLKEQCKIHSANKLHSIYKTPAELFKVFLTLRHQIVPKYLADCADRILELNPTMVGFTCMFDQTIASVALAKLLKEANPELTVALGGYAVQHENGLEVIKAFSDIDCVARGDGEPIISDLAWASVGAKDFDKIPGILTKTNYKQCVNNPPKADLSQADAPNYDDWFDDIQRVQQEHEIRIKTLGLPLESSRGCWWGQKQHCIFCGIDEETLKYRSKSADQIIAELTELVESYGNDYSFRFSDYILPHHFHETLLPKLALFKPKLRLEAEIKANQTREKLEAFADAGFEALQPGIESFSTPVLRRMDKGVRGIQNVQLLKWGYLDKIIIDYNILYGLPGDTVDEYIWLIENTPRLYHLTPPISRTETIITRFAPLQTSPHRFGILRKPTAHKCYDVLFSKAFLAESKFSLDNYCYYFERHFEYPEELTVLYNQLVIQVNHWKEQQSTRDVYLSHEKTESGYVFEDTRYEISDNYQLTGLVADVYSQCDQTVTTVAEIIKRLDANTDREQNEVQKAIHELNALRLIWVEGNALLGLAIPKEIVQKHNDSGWKFEWKSLYV